MSSQQHCVITNVDSLLGYALAHTFLERKQHEQGKLRLLCRSKHGLEKLQQMGGEIHEIDYQDENRVREAIKDVRGIILIPENSQQRVKEAENVIKVAKSANVEHVAMMSFVGVDRVQEQQQGEYRHLREYRQIEQKVQEQFSGKHCIVRHSLLNQIFYFFAPMIEGKNQLRLPVKKEQKWGSVDLNDAVEAIRRLAQKNERNSFFGPFRGPQGEHKQVWQFTPRKNFNGEELARHIGEGLGRDRPVQYEDMNQDEMREYLRKMRDDDRFKERPHQQGQSDKPQTFPLGRYLNDQKIDLLLEVWKLASQGKADITTNDLQEALEHDPQDIREYFKNNRDQFRRLK